MRTNAADTGRRHVGRIAIGPLDRAHKTRVPVMLTAGLLAQTLNRLQLRRGLDQLGLCLRIIDV